MPRHVSHEEKFVAERAHNVCHVKLGARTLVIFRKGSGKHVKTLAPAVDDHYARHILMPWIYWPYDIRQYVLGHEGQESM